MGAFAGEEELGEVAFDEFGFELAFGGGSVDELAALGVVVEVELVDVEAVVIVVPESQSDFEDFEGAVAVEAADSVGAWAELELVVVAGAREFCAGNFFFSRFLLLVTDVSR